MRKLNKRCRRSAGTTDNDNIFSCRRYFRAKIHHCLFAVFKSETLSTFKNVKVVNTFFAAGVNQSAMVTVHVSSILLTATKQLDCILTDRHVTVRTK